MKNKLFFYIFLTFLTIFSFCFNHILGESVTKLKVFSNNENFYLESIPFDSKRGTKLGKTFVKHMTSDSVIYEIDRYFGQRNISISPQNVHLSDDGKYIAYLDDDMNSIKDLKDTCLFFYNSGNLNKVYSFYDLLINKINNYDFLSYFDETIIIKDSIKHLGYYWNKEFIYKNTANEKEIRIMNNPVFLSNDTLVLVTGEKEIWFFNIISGEMLNHSSELSLLDKYNPVKVKYENTSLDFPAYYSLPNLKNGQSCNSTIGTLINKTYLKPGYYSYNKWRIYRLFVWGFITQDGYFSNLQLYSQDSLDLTAVYSFFDTCKLDVDIKTPFDKVYFDAQPLFRTTDTILAKTEKAEYDSLKKIYYQKMINLDTLYGKYIPKDIEDCFYTLNKELKPKTIEKIKNFECASDMVSEYHHGLGRWIRNNWGLWSGSRLSEYFKQRLSYYHVDGLSSIILANYWYWLNDNDKWREWEKDIHGPDDRIRNVVIPIEHEVDNEDLPVEDE